MSGWTLVQNKGSTTAKPTTSLLDLPDELLQEIFRYLDATSAAAFGAATKRLQAISNAPLLWQDYCLQGWQYWQENVSGRHPVDTPWKEIYISKRKADSDVLRIFDTLLSTQQGRLAHMETIATGFMYDAKDMLLRLTQTPDEAEDVLARRYYSEAVLGLIHRTRALQIWDDMQYQDYPALEQALGAYDLFVRGVELSELTAELDALTHKIREACPHIDELDYRAKSVEVAKGIRQFGPQSPGDTEYHALRNNFMHLALTGQRKTSLPLQYTVIFCCVAQRFGLRAWPCNYPWHIHAVVESPDYPPLYQSRASQTLNPGVIWMDPWRHHNVVEYDHLRSQLHSYGIVSEDALYGYLAPSFTRDLVLRTGRNIMTSVNEARDAHVDSEEGGLDLDAAFYSFLWSYLLVGPNETREMNFHRRQHYIPYLLEQYKQHFPEDVVLLEQYVLPMFYRHAAHRQLIELVEECRAVDRNARPVTRRTENSVGVKYKVGQFFRHARYDYLGIIVGWDTNCRAGNAWISQMRVQQLPRGTEQSFYNILGADKSSRYVAEENIIPLEETPPPGLMKLAGRYFKRWDPESKIFISNIKDEYPDD